MRQIQNDIKSLESNAKVSQKHFDVLYPLEAVKEEGLDLWESIEKMILAKWQKDYGHVYVLSADFTGMKEF